MKFRKVLAHTYHISFPRFYKGLNYLGGRILGCNEYGNKYGAPELLDKLCVPEPLITRIMARRVMELMVKPKAHEPKISEFMLSQRGSLFVDIGAWLGYFPFLLYNNFRRNLALEPDPRNFKVINEVKRIYNFHRVQALPLAVSNKTGSAKLYVSHFLPIHGESSLVKSGVKSRNGTHVKVLKGGFIQVETITLDNLFKHHPSIDLIKVDVEGGEWKVLEGATKVMDKIGSWIIELHDLQRKKRLDDLMESYGYGTNWVDPRHAFYTRT